MRRGWRGTMHFHQWERRSFLTLLGGTAAWPFAARAEQAVPIIGFLGSTSRDLYESRLRAFHQGLKETGYVEGENAAIEYRWADGENERLPALAGELVQRRVAVIVAAGGTPSALAAKAATTTVPIVFGVAVDPVEVGLVASLNRPGGNVTGVTSLNVEIGPKRLELLRELIPAATTIALLVNPTSPRLAEQFSRAIEAAARALGLQTTVLHASSERDFDTVFGKLARLRADALLISPDNFLTAESRQLAALALRHEVPAFYQYRPFAVAGGLVSYGSSEAEYYRMVGTYAGKVLRGESPAELPVQQATKVELIINLKTAKTLGIAVPLPLSGRADEVIE